MSYKKNYHFRKKYLKISGRQFQVNIIFTYSSIINTKMIAGMLCDNAQHSLYTNMIIANVLFLRLFGRMFEFFSTTSNTKILLIAG